MTLKRIRTTGVAKKWDRKTQFCANQPMTDPRSPSELRSTFGANLRALSQRAPSISALCRSLGINRTQFNRYLAGDSFPRPDLLHKICHYFNVDARILLEPLDAIEAPRPGPLNHPAIAPFLGRSADPLPEVEFPNGFYRFVRRSFMDETRFVQGLVFVFRQDGLCFLRGYEARQAMLDQGLSADGFTREFRGAVLGQEDGVAALVSRRGATTATYNYLARIPSFENNLWVGYTVRPVRENVAGRRIERQIYEHIGNQMTRVLPAARTAGFCTLDDLVPYQRQLLDPENPVT